jgi:hypothetical protein
MRASHHSAEPMLLRFISLLLVLFQESIQSICIDESHMERWLPCRSRGGNAVAHYGVVASTGREAVAEQRRSRVGAALPTVNYNTPAWSVCIMSNLS